MGGNAGAGGAWPSENQELLLRAGLLRGAEATDAWQRWQIANDINKIDQGSFRLLPLVYRNLSANSVNYPLTGRLKGIYRFTLYRNLNLWRHVSPALRPQSAR